MNRRLFLFFLSAVVIACSKKPQGHRPLLLVSVSPYQTLVESIAGEEFEVKTAVPMGADPHTWEPTPQQFTQIAQGKIWFRLGEPFESKLLPFFQSSQVVDLRDNISLIQEDRHLWLSPKLLGIQAERIASTLSSYFPERKEIFKERLTKIMEDLKLFDVEIEQQLRPAKSRTFLISHSAFAYFCRDYDCKELSIEVEGKEPCPKELESTLRTAIQEQAILTIALPQHNNKGAKRLADHLHIPLKTIDPYASDYFSTMRKLAQLIALSQHDERD